MNQPARWIFVSLLSLPVLVAWVQTAHGDEYVAPRTERTAAAPSLDEPRSATTQAAVPPLGEYPAPQVDESTPAQDPTSTF